MTKELTPDQLRALQQVFPEGGVMFECGKYGDQYNPRQWVEYTDGHIVQIADSVYGSQANVRPLRRVDIPPLDPVRVRFEAWKATLTRGPSGFYKVGDEGGAWPTTSLWPIFQSIEKFKEAGE